MNKTKRSPHQIQVVKYKCGLVHLTQDQQHLIIYELLVFREVTAHVLLQLGTDLVKITCEKVCMRARYSKQQAPTTRWMNI